MREPGSDLLDRLMGGAEQDSSQRTVEQLKVIVARDLEALLNTRVVPRLYDDHSYARASVLNYGLADFAGMCLSSCEDRDALCASIRSAIEIHEPRLANVSASLEPRGAGVNRLHIVISATLLAGPRSETARFDAVLQPSTLRCSISSARQRGSQA